ncbi:hypothetical protein H8E07_11060 [bacterium]|nr:hypothetical protein [bacterium]
MVLLERDESGELVLTFEFGAVAIARCVRCKKRVRVLPCDILPHKVYSTDVIEHLVADYAQGNLSLRKVAWEQLGERTPAHTALHGWTEGLGAHALGRSSGDAGGAPISHLVAIAKSRVGGVTSANRMEVHVNPVRYRSEARRDRLAALIRTMAMVVAIAGLSHPRAIAECRRLALVWSNSSVLLFPSCLRNTAIEHLDRPEPARSLPSSSRNKDRCLTPTRSPPGASSKSPH